MGRRDEVIAEATALLRESGPRALTSVNVAARLGVTQSAIYRHIRDMDELTTIASTAVVDELASVMFAAVASPETDGNDGSHLALFSERVVDCMMQHAQAFGIVDRWRYDDGQLGTGIRSLLDAGAQMVAGELETAWRREFRHTRKLNAQVQAAQLAHAMLIIDDVVAVARSMPVDKPSQRRHADRMLRLRLFAGWCGYVQDLHHRYGLPMPTLGDAEMASPLDAARVGALV
jgi:AcrR family transcriptional regulator